MKQTETMEGSWLQAAFPRFAKLHSYTTYKLQKGGTAHRVAWTYPYQSLIKAIPYRLAHRPIR